MSADQAASIPDSHRVTGCEGAFVAATKTTSSDSAASGDPSATEVTGEAPAKKTAARKAPAKKTAAKKTAAKKAPAKKTAAKKNAAKKTAAKKTASPAGADVVEDDQLEDAGDSIEVEPDTSELEDVEVDVESVEDEQADEETKAEPSAKDKASGDFVWDEDESEALRQARKDAELTASACLLYTSPSPRDLSTSRMPSSA